MKQRSERWTVFRLAFGCASASGSGCFVLEGAQGKKQKDVCIIKKTKHPLRFRLIPNANLLYHGFRRFITRLKGVSRVFVYKIEMDEEEEEDDEEDEMEIGHPTDVKHLTHIGWDGSTTVSKAVGKQWQNNLTPSEIISFPSISLKHFELAMSQQADAAASAATVNNNV